MTQYVPVAQPRPDRYKVAVSEYVEYQSRGYVVVKGLVPQDDVEVLTAHAMDLMEGRVCVAAVPPVTPQTSPAERQRQLSRIHMLHRVDGMCERFLLHARVLDVLEILVGPDVLALQTMLFFNAPGTGGQGWHQDAYYITTYPDTLIGAWLALDRADEENGCMWMAPRSSCEPIYPDERRGALVHARGGFSDMVTVEGISQLDDATNTLSDVARRYAPWEPVPADPGDVVFFHARLLHRSYPNRSRTRWRRAFVSHYCNARSWVPWNHGAPYDGEAANCQHILARGTTHLPFARPRFGTPCAALEQGTEPRLRVVAAGGEMEMVPAGEGGEG
ncbi:MAG: phytanoyl-CoA dioxygenase family protein [Candidatus Latescibacterota bacterium]